MKKREGCRICNGSFRVVIDAGKIYPSEFIETSPRTYPQPMVLVQCERCGLVQLQHTIDPDSAYRRYWYKSSLNRSMVQALKDVVAGIEKRVEVNSGDVVVDIGANDGTLLGLYTQNPTRIGFDPAHNLAEEAGKQCSIFINDYFHADLYPVYRKAKVVTSIAMFYDLDDPHRFTHDVKSIMAPDGVWVIQMTDLVSMLKANAFDNICMEHLEYYSLSVLKKLMLDHRLDIFDIEFNAVNGGSLRAYICHGGARQPTAEVAAALQAEREYLASFPDPFRAFQERITAIKQKVVNFVQREVGRQQCFCVMGASTKGNTLLQYFGLDHSLINFAAEVNMEKIGRKTVGTNIIIISEDLALQKKPDYCLVLPWHFINGFVERNRPYLERGGKFMVPLPEPAVIDQNGWHFL